MEKHIEDSLSDLKDEIYNAEDFIDGCYNSKGKGFEEFVEINKRYEQLLKDMNELINLIEKTIE